MIQLIPISMKSGSPILMQKGQQFLALSFESESQIPSDLLDSSNGHKEWFASQLLLNIVYTIANY